MNLKRTYENLLLEIEHFKINDVIYWRNKEIGFNITGGNINGYLQQ